MKNLEKYKNTFIETFGITEKDLLEDLAYQSIDSWDQLTCH